VLNTKASIEGIDMEWVQLILEAKKLGLDKEEIREFLQSNVVKEQVQNR
jgi:antagonist of SinR